MGVPYGPASGLESPRFVGVRTFARLPYVRDLAGVDVAVIGVPFDTGATFRVGCRFGPAAIREASVMLRPYNPYLEIQVFDYVSAVDYGDLPVVPGYIEASYERIVAGLEPVLAAGVVPILLGGDHSITLAHLRAVVRRHGPVALVHIDAHGDIWDEYWGQRYTHGTPFRRAVEEGLLDVGRSIQVGMRGPLYSPQDLQLARDLGFEVISGRELRRRGTTPVGEAIRARVGSRPAFLSFDVDFVDPAFAPGTGTPEVGGPTSAEALDLARGLVGVNLVAADVVEVLPAYDGPGQVTALLAANVVYELMSVVACNRRAARAQAGEGHHGGDPGTGGARAGGPRAGRATARGGG
ncbi:MAG: agmatinase [Armatimonadota bacterium]|nr:agmatinase [Armatimonadota bacterium]MDR7505969.1 agmatinase [Armatimonadota bacterium]